MKNYVLVIRSPFNPFDVLAELSSETPFLTLSVGDTINPDSFDLENFKELQSQLLRVAEVQHLIGLTDDDRAKHRIDIFTEAVTDTVVAQQIRKVPDVSREVAKVELAKLLGVSPDELPD